MTVFGSYSNYYDLIYSDKDYRGETDYIISIMRKYAPNSHSILDLGCGTGTHAELLAERGYKVCGVDMSPEMLKRASAKVSDWNRMNLSFVNHDIRNLRLNETFDVVVALFHVMSYQTSNIDIASALETAKKHLKPNGVFIFDCWYGPAVLTKAPEVRVKRLEDDLISVFRVAEPTLHPEKNVVDVNYCVYVKSKKGLEYNEYHETHRMRYFFRPEIELFCATAGFEVVDSFEWMTDKSPGCDCWSACFVVKS